jgi:hypothetical protein
MHEQDVTAIEAAIKSVRAGTMDASLPKTVADGWSFTLADAVERLLAAVRDLDRRVQSLESDRNEGRRATSGLI